jgi:hypothetical protein
VGFKGRAKRKRDKEHLQGRMYQVSICRIVQSFPGFGLISLKPMFWTHLSTFLTM